jgi:hypothetical protein
MPHSGDHEKKDPLIRAVTNEYALLLYRFVTGGCALLMTWWVLDLKNATFDIRKDFNASLVANEARLGKLEGAVSVMDNAIRMQSRTIETNQTSIQQLWNRMYEFNQLQRAK